MVETAQESIKLCAPYVKTSVINGILNKKNKNTKLSLITNVNFGAYLSKSSDLDALHALKNIDSDIYNFQNLHAKIYIFDDKKVVITSANLTYSGLNTNYEYGVVMDESVKVFDEVLEDYVKMISSDLCGKITNEDLNLIQDKLKNLDPFDVYIDNDSDLLIANKAIESIVHSFTTWQKNIYDCINMLDKEIFTLKDIYGYIDYLKEKHPNNKNIEAKIRQQLQMLRDLGLVKFLSPGVYKRLWTL